MSLQSHLSDNIPYRAILDYKYFYLDSMILIFYIGLILGFMFEIRY